MDEDDDEWDEYESFESYSYDEDGTVHYNDGKEEKVFSPEGVLVYYNENRYGDIWVESKFDLNGRKAYEKIYSTRDGVITDRSEYSTTYDDAGHVIDEIHKDYDDERYPFTEQIFEYNEFGELTYSKTYQILYVDPDTGLYTNKKTENVKEIKITYDDHGNEIEYESRKNGVLSDESYVYRGNYIYDKNDRLVYGFFGSYYENSLGANTECWYDYDENGFVTHEKIKAYGTGAFGSSDPKKVPVYEYFYINEYSYHKNGKIKECIRYYCENENYNRGVWQADLLRLSEIKKEEKRPKVVYDPMNDARDFVTEIRFESSNKYIDIGENFGVSSQMTPYLFTTIFIITLVINHCSR